MQSLVTPFGASYYFSSKSLTVEVYQGLVDRGWRRSGTVFYKPDVLRHCCPHYTIRLPAASFTPAKDQRQAVNRWNRFVLGDEYLREAARLHPKSKEEKARQRNTFDLITAVHESEYTNVKRPPEPAHRFEITLEPDTFTPEKYELFHNYQQHVHHEKPSEISENGFKRFLCGSPLRRKTAQKDGKPQPLGSHHQCYRLDGRLIAMAVLDLLPHCVSGVYFIYHADFEKWSFGKLSALRETALALEGGYQYYYMGYYIHSCAKMRYKGEYRPQHVLDPESYEWNPLDGELRTLLDRKTYVSLSRERRRKELSLKDEGLNEPAPDEAGVDDFSDYPLPSASEAGEAIMDGTSLFDLKIPGVMTAEEVENDYELDHQRLQARGRLFEADDLMAWESGDIRDPKSLKGIIAELVACLGADVARQVVVSFS
ncbi:arginine-tRNA-protein transferase 1 [Trematosphaeria pertusa]|uniref:Arginyl-tRNA--protein transferase 1 n=1 Tax=Trematosphaeria pertusa TaxID=390896 RepID=A0A6A6J345_9PLEO|nr:arginine-tRNA-protein transferase 1 [Trematosphaeria pertusa]KAF2256767.1 arginine-tRNA-protein transferase 1 [Trematosphaeria pertusa]